MIMMTMMRMTIVMILDFEVTDPGMHFGPKTTKKTPVTVVEDVVCISIRMRIMKMMMMMVMIYLQRKSLCIDDEVYLDYAFGLE